MATVLFVCAVGGHGGPVASLRDILPGLAGHRRVCIGPFSDYSLPVLRQLCEDVLPMPRPRGARACAAAISRVRRAIKTQRPDVVFANGLTEAAVVSVALTALGTLGSTPVVVWVHNFELPALTEPTAGFLKRKDFRFFAVSELAAGLVRQAGLAEHVEIVPNPLPDDVVATPVPATERVRVAYLGTDRRYKGFDYLAPVIQQLRDLPITWRLHLPNSGRPGWEAMEALLEDPGLDVRVLGRVSPVSRAYAQADIVFVPSRQESFCRVVSESMVNGVPVVASALEPIRELVGPDEAGRLVPSGDIDGYAAALRTLVGDAGLRARLGAAGRERAARYQPEGIQARWRAVIDQVSAG